MNFITFETNGRNNFYTLWTNCRFIGVSILERSVLLESLKNSTFLQLNIDEFYFIYEKTGNFTLELITAVQNCNTTVICAIVAVRKNASKKMCTFGSTLYK
jgi:hypothetical protein